MPSLPAAAVHANRTCSNCHRVMLNARWAQANPEGIPDGAVVHQGRGACIACYTRTWRAARSVLSDPTVAAVLRSAYRGPVMSDEDTYAGYARWRDARRRRLEASRG